jgi:hypothetical protein
VKMYLEDLTRTGLYGCSPQEAARQLLSGAINALIKDGTISKRDLKVKGSKANADS